jgi:hypothetical protein
VFVIEYYALKRLKQKTQVTKAVNFVAEQVTGIDQQVRKINTQDTDKIAGMPYASAHSQTPTQLYTRSTSRTLTRLQLENRKKSALLSMCDIRL